MMIIYASTQGISSYQIWLPKTLARSKQLVARGPADDKVLREIDTPDAIEAADEGLPGLLVDAGDDGADEEGPEPALVQGAGDEVCEGGRRDVALLAQAVHVDLVAEEVGDGAHVGGQARQAQVHVAVVEDLGEVVGDGQGLETETQVAGYGDAVLADHGHAGAAIWEERLAM